MPATVRRAGTLSLTVNAVAYSCNVKGFQWAFVGTEIYTGCSPSDGAALTGRAGDGALYELTVDMLSDFSSGSLDLAMLTDTVGETLAYTLLVDTEGDGTYARTYSGNLLVPHVLESWEAGTVEEVTLTFPVLTRTAGTYTS